MDSKAMLSPEEALQRVMATAAPLPPRAFALSDANGLILAQKVVADRDYPPFRRAMMDGYAVRVADAGRTLPVAGEVPAGRLWTGELAAGQCLEIMTGAACPPGAEAVVEKEAVCREADCVRLPEKIGPGQHIATVGSECDQGEEILAPGSEISALAIAAMASVGLDSVLAVPRPRLAIIVTGSELSATGAAVSVGIRDANGPMLAAMAADLGLAPPLRVTVPDREDAILDALVAAEPCDLVCLAGGVSAGTYDLVPAALRRYGAEVVFHRVAQKPGKPLLLARKGPQVLFGLPGNPLGCHWCFHGYVSAAIGRMAGRPGVQRPLTGRLGEAVASKPGRARFIPGLARWEAAGWQLRPQPGVSSADIFHTARANCYLHVPGDRATVAAGEILTFSLLSRELP